MKANEIYHLKTTGEVIKVLEVAKMTTTMQVVVNPSGDNIVKAKVIITGPTKGFPVLLKKCKAEKITARGIKKAQEYNKNQNNTSVS